MESKHSHPLNQKEDHLGHRKRLREKFLQSGLSGFHDYEVIELLLTLGTPRKDCKSIAKETLRRFSSLQAVLDASPESLQEIKGIGPTNLFGLKLVKAVAERYMKRQYEQKVIISNSEELYRYLNFLIQDRSRESFVVIFLDAKNKVIDSEILFIGSLTSTNVYPREVIRAALRYQAASLLFAHNHPSGDPKPSYEDNKITKSLIFACRLMGINVHEHLIVGSHSYFSFADHGIIAEMNQAFDAKQ